MDDPQLDGVIGTVYHISNGGLGNAAFYVQLILRHALFIEHLRQPLADGLIEFHPITTLLRTCH